MVAAGLLAGMSFGAAAAPRNVRNGEPAGAFALPSLDGKTIDTARFAGKPMIWIFAAANQASSHKALTLLQKVVDETPPPGAAAVLLAADSDDLSALRQFLSRENIRVPVGIDAGRTQYGRLGVIVLPTTVLVDAKGRFHETLSGCDLKYEHRLRAHVDYLAGRINAEELARQLTSAVAPRDEARERAELLRQSATRLVRLGQLEQAARELADAMKADPTFEPASLDLALIKLAQHDAGAADGLVQGVLKADPNHRHARLVLGVLRFHEKRLDEAEQALRQAQLLNPEPALTSYWLGRVLQAKGDEKGAAACFREASERMLPPPDSLLVRSGE